MKNYHLIILGKTGFGKTSMARMVAAVCPRLLVLDFDNDPIWNSIGTTIRSPTQAAQFFMDHWRDDFQVVLRFQEIADYYTYLQGVYYLQDKEDLGPLAIIMEEAGLFSGSYNIQEELENVIVRGRRKNISVVSIAQETTQINPTVRGQAATMVFFRMGRFSSDLKEQLNPEEMRTMQRLEALDPMTRPEYGRHYVTVPPNENPIRRMADTMLHDGDPELPPDYQPPI